MWASGFTARIRAATATPTRSAVCMGTATTASRARCALSGSNGSTDTSMTAGWKPRASSAAADQATVSGWCPSS